MTMNQVLSFAPRMRPPTARQAPSGPASIIIFPGVRYERDQAARQQQAEPQAAAAAKTVKRERAEV